MYGLPFSCGNRACALYSMCVFKVHTRVAPRLSASFAHIQLLSIPYVRVSIFIANTNKRLLTMKGADTISLILYL